MIYLLIHWNQIALSVSACRGDQGRLSLAVQIGPFMVLLYNKRVVELSGCEIHRLWSRYQRWRYFRAREREWREREAAA